MRVSVIPDGHLDHGVHGLWNIEAWRRACKRIIAERHDVCVVGGDLFHTGNPKGEAIRQAAIGMRRMADAGVTVVYVCGNHEWIGVDVSRGHMPAAMALNEIDGVTVVIKPKALRVEPGICLALMPWPAPELGSEASHMESIRRIIEVCGEQDDPCLAIAHAAVAETKLRGSEIELAALTREWTVARSEIDVPEVLGHTALGHIHQRVALSPTCGYVGSMEAITFADEGQDKGFSVFSLHRGGWHEDLAVVGRREFATLQLSDIDDQIERLGEGAIVRVEIPEGARDEDIPLQLIKDAGLVSKGAYRPPSQSDQEERSVDADAEDFCALNDIEVDDDMTLLERYAERERINEEDTEDMLDEATAALGWD